MLQVQDAQPVVRTPPQLSTPRPHLHVFTDEYDMGMVPTPRTPFLHEYPSTQSLPSSMESDDGDGVTMDDGDLSRLTQNGSSSHPRRRQPRRAYHPEEVARMGSRHFRNISRSIRKASVRVANLMTPDTDKGMTRLPDHEEDEDIKDAYEMYGIEPEPLPIPPLRPDAKPPELGLRGRTLCLFTKDNPVRKALDALLRFP